MGAQSAPKSAQMHARSLPKADPETDSAPSKRPQILKMHTVGVVTLWHDFPGPKRPQKLPKTLPKITKTSPGDSPEGTCKTVCKKVIPFSQNYPTSDPGGIPNGRQNPSKITLWSTRDPPAAANRSQRCSGRGHHPNWTQKS